jgi:hypothetical protein
MFESNYWAGPCTHKNPADVRFNSKATELSRRSNAIARTERSAMQGSRRETAADYAALHPGYWLHILQNWGKYGLTNAALVVAWPVSSGAFNALHGCFGT